MAYCFLSTLVAKAQGTGTIYSNGTATADNQRIESLTPPSLYVLRSVPAGPTAPTGTFRWFKNGLLTTVSTPAYYATEPGVYRFEYNSVFSNYVIINFGSGADTRNYVLTDQARLEGIKESHDLNRHPEFNKEITYSDGLGRPLQSIGVRAAPGTYKDVVQPFSYGPQGEETKAYLPFAIGNNGKFKEDWIGDQNAFHQSVSPKVGRPGNGPAYSEVVSDDDPLGRVSEQAGPGEAWKLGAGHTRQASQRSNTAGDDVRRYAYVPAASIGIAGTLSGWNGTAIPANTLSAARTKDEDHNWAVVFADEKGQTVCQRTYLQSEPGLATSTPIYLETNYVYDAAGRLLAVIPPKASKQLKSGALTAADALSLYAFLTQYDALGRPIAHKVPGKGWTFTVYDRWDRVAATQDPKQLARGKWSFVKYDALNRAVMTGEVTDGRGPATLAADLQSWPVGQRSEQRADNAAGYTLTQTFPNTIQVGDVATVDYYDDYEYFPLRPGQRADLAFVAELNSTAASTQTRGLRTGGRTRTLLATSYDRWLTSVVYYDQHGRAVQAHQDNFTLNAGGTSPAVDHTTTQYEFTGEPKIIRLTHRRYDVAGALETHITETTNTYDGRGRLLNIDETIDAAPVVNLANFEYNELGQLVDKKLGYDKANSSYIQSLDYRYNVRGWLTNINNRNRSNNQWIDNSTPNSDAEPQDAFGLELKYESGGTATGCYNGNISAAVWSTDRGPMRQYGYEYDKANRLEASRFGALEYVGGNYVFTAEKYDANAEGRYTTSGIAYDENGNITALNRSGLVTPNVTSGTRGFGRIDELTFTHDGNRLNTVIDAISASAATNDFENGPTSGQPYRYDANGNLEYDPNKGVLIEYNQLNLPYAFYFDNNNVIYNNYASTGEKLSTSYTTYSPTSPATTETVQYIQGFTYSTRAAEPLTVATPTGRAVFEGPASGTTPARWAHEYHIRDHQGSLRLVMKQEPVLARNLTLEPANGAEEEAHFERVPETRQLDADHARSGYYSARLNARQADRANGPASVLAVAAGDSVYLAVYGLYDRGKAAPRLRNAVAPALAIGGSLLPAGATGPDDPARTRRGWAPAVTAGVAVAWDRLRGVLARPQPVPQASFTYELYDQDSVLVTSATCQLAATGQAEWQQLQHGFRAKSAGYVKVYLANASGTDAWFDDMALRLFPVPVVQENHYDPFGQNLEEIELASGNDSKQQYTGQEKNDGFSLNLYDYDSRSYDFQLGRFHGTDGAASSYTSQGPYNYCLNNPVNHVDPDGKHPLLLFVAAAAVGGGYNLLNAALAGKITSFEKAVVYFGVGAVGAAAAIANPYAGFAVGGSLNLLADTYYGEFQDMSTGNKILGGALSFISGGISATGGASSAKEAFPGLRTGSTKVGELASKFPPKPAQGGNAKIPVGRSGNPMSSVARNVPTTIDGTKFTGHALSQMQARGILSPRAVLDVIRNPTSVLPGNTPGELVFLRDNLKVVVNKLGDIITVMPIHR